MSQTEFQKYIHSKKFKDLLAKYEEGISCGSMPYIDTDDLIDIAEYYHINNRMADSEKAVEYCLELSPNDEYALFFKARLMLTVYHNPTEAQRIIESIDDYKSLIESIYILAEVKMQQGKADEAEDMLQKEYRNIIKEIEEKADGVDTSYNDDEEDDDNDEISAEETLSRFPLDVATLYCDYGFLEYADSWLCKVKDCGGELSFEYYETLGRLRLYQNKYAEAIDAFNNALDVDAYNVAIWMQLSEAQSCCEKYADALQSIEYALAIEPNAEDAMLMKGNALYDLARYDDAMTLFRHMEERQPANPQINLFLAALCFETECRAEGMKEFQKALEKSNYDIIIITQVGISLYELGYTDAAYDLLSTVFYNYLSKEKDKECPQQMIDCIIKCCEKLNKENEANFYKQYLEKRISNDK